jgi:protein-S-isoprenylcysteine O-methyltransferase Ste14
MAMKPLPRFAFVMGGTVLYLALAVLGGGGFAAFFCHASLIVLTIAFIAMSVAGFFAGGSLSPGIREDRGNRWVLIDFGVIGLLLAYLPAYTDRLDFWTIDGHVVRWVGIVLFIVGGGLRLWPVYVLGNRFSGLVAIQPGHRLLTTGIYNIIRHPSYLGLLTNALGWSLAFRSGVGVLLALANLPPLIARINAEERLLSSEFGAEYDAYRTRTARLIPGIY